jgi:AraC-like DNA-binding protein
MQQFSRVINNVQFRYAVAEMREAIHPMQTVNTYIPNNFLLQVNRGDYWEGEQWEKMPEGSFYFVPQGHHMFFRMMPAQQYDEFGWDGYGSESTREKYSRRIHPGGPFTGKSHYHTIVSFDALLYGTIPFFSVLDLPAITLPPDEEMSYLVHELALEEGKDRLGKEVLLQSMTQELVIRICRQLAAMGQFTSYMEKMKFLTDKRLVDVISYIRNNLDKDLSNKSLAAISFLSEDYIGQFFKSLTNQNLQDYVEKQRLEKARQMLNSTPFSIQEIAFKTGFRDPAYFSRRFKLLYNQSANELRKA